MEMALVPPQFCEEEGEPTVWVAHESLRHRAAATTVCPLPLRAWCECEAVVPLRAYDADLGMRTRAAVRRQLTVDLPRSVVLVNGRRAVAADDVTAAVSHPRLCTQAVLAPPVEWLLRAGWVAHELPAAEPMVVDAGARTVRVCKRLGLRDAHDVATDDESDLLDIGVHADAVHQSVVVTLVRRRPAPRP